jgi:gamma-glutamylcyclotransferase (GGCT)/AIG2-like uncharacterized protein YtfP
MRVAVYGTLRPGGRAYAAFDLARRTRHLGACRIPGRIVDLGGYPGLIDTDDRSGAGVAGDILAIDDAELIAELDVYEGSDYQRVTVTLLTPVEAVEVWRWRHDASTVKPVPGNDWTRRESDEIDPADDPAARRGTAS